eukprot:m51a1_g26 hypothetical protein (336) ;mRNA; f:108682-110190
MMRSVWTAGGDPATRSWTVFFVLTAGVWVGFLVLGITQEAVYTTGFSDSNERFVYPTFLLSSLTLSNVVVSFCVMWSQGMQVRAEAPWAHYGGISATICGSLMLSNRAIMLACKPLPIALAGVLCGHGTTSPRRLAHAGLICAGLAGLLFLRSERAEAGRRLTAANWVGVALASLSLVCDGAVGLLQDRLVVRFYRADARVKRLAPWHIMFHQNLYSLIIFFSASLLTGELWGALDLCVRHPRCAALVALFGASASAGGVFIVQFISRYDALTCNVVTASRKFATIALSVMLFSHWVSLGQWLAIVTVFVGLALDATYVNAPPAVPQDKPTESTV